jgi:ABC-type multidrug transport system ATPase subunit
MLTVRGLGCIREGHRALEGITIELSAGSLSLVTGPNGAGKTSLLRCLAGLDPHDAGTIELDGVVVDVASTTWKSAVALVPDDNALFGELSVEEHAELACILAAVPREEARDRIAPLLELLSLTPYRARRSGELSFGYRKRLAIALSLLQPATLYLFDEPLVGLDVPALELFRGILGLLRDRGRIVVVASHITAPLASLADLTVAMRAGRTVGGAPGGGEPAPILGEADLPWLR